MRIHCALVLTLLTCLTLPASAQDADDNQALFETLKKYRSAEAPEDKLAILSDFAEKYPDHARLVDSILYEYVKIHRQSGDTDGAIALVTAAHKRTSNPNVRVSAAALLAGLYGDSRRGNDLKLLAAEQTKFGEINYYLHEAIVKASTKLGMWELSQEHCEAALALATPEAVLKEIPASRNFPKERLTAIAGWRRGEILANRGWALVNLDRDNEADASFEKARESTAFDFIGVSQNSYATLWAKTLLRRDAVDEAIKVAAPNALYQGREDALEIVKEAYLHRAGDDGDFESFKLDLRLKLAKTTEDFTLRDYDGAAHKFSQLKGKVTVLVFWFPT